MLSELPPFNVQCEGPTLLPARLGGYVFSDCVTTPIVRAQHGDASGVRGAAWLWPVDDTHAARSLT